MAVALHPFLSPSPNALEIILWKLPSESWRNCCYGGRVLQNYPLLIEFVQQAQTILEKLRLPQEYGWQESIKDFFVCLRFTIRLAPSGGNWRNDAVSACSSLDFTLNLMHDWPTNIERFVRNIRFNSIGC